MKISTFLIRHAVWLVAIAILVWAIVSVPELGQPSYWALLCQSRFAIAALALALMPIMLTGGIDLSVGSTTVLSSVVIGYCWHELSWPIEAALAMGLLVGLFAGLVNGGLVTIGVMPLVATLATRELFRGMALTLSGDTPVTLFPKVLRSVWRTPLLGLPLSVYLLGFLVLATFMVVHHTRFGRMLFAIGDNETAARFAALPVRRVKLAVYAWAGLIAGLCGAAVVMHFDSAKADYGQSLELTAIACLILGGQRITGGSGHVVAALMGIVSVIALQAYLQQTAATWRDTIMGALLLVVALGNEAARRAERRKPPG